jgi:hypothetical protein
MRAEIDYADWHAIHDHMGKSLHITGTCHIQGGGIAAQLAPHERPLPNPLMLPLDLVLTPTGETPSSVKIDWHQAWDDDGYQYNEVSFFVRDGTIDAEAPPTLPVEDAH